MPGKLLPYMLDAARRMGLGRAVDVRRPAPRRIVLPILHIETRHARGVTSVHIRSRKGLGARCTITGGKLATHRGDRATLIAFFKYVEIWGQIEACAEVSP